MKRIAGILAAGFMLSMAAINRSEAQVNVSVNIGSQPLWGPTGYDNVQYYYLPDLEMYYYVPKHQYVYMTGGRWVFATNPPTRYRNFDFYSVHKVVVNEPRPYTHFEQHRKEYAQFKGERGRQENIRDSRDRKYYAVKGHPHYNERDRGNNGNGRGNGKGNNGNGRGGRH